MLPIPPGNRWGGWNKEIYDATHALLDVGYGLDQVESAVLGAAHPWDRREEAAARATIRSAWRGNASWQGGA